VSGRPTTTATEREHDQWARRYLAAVMRRDTAALVILCHVDPCRCSAWGRLDAVAATARDLIGELASPDDAAALLSRRLIRDALAESPSPDTDTA
jgi:arginine utilization protein RocB